MHGLRSEGLLSRPEAQLNLIIILINSLWYFKVPFMFDEVRTRSDIEIDIIVSIYGKRDGVSLSVR